MEELHRPLADDPFLKIYAGKGRAMKRLISTLDAVASTKVPVLIQGESGTGKELCVRWLHDFSGLPSSSLTRVNCPAIPQALLESELFGYERGAFTGANKTKQGLVEQADGGTFFLDEIGSLDLTMQVKLLRFLQDGSFSRVGGHDLLRVDTRLVTTANRNLNDQVAEGEFRLDLLYRVNAVTVTVPPLRERPEDIPDFVEHFLRVHSTAYGTKPPSIPRDVMLALTRYSWPGNIRQLDNLLRSYALLGSLDVLVPEESPSKSNSATIIDFTKPSSLKDITKEATRDLERQIILGALRANGWNRRKTAEWLKISYRSLLYKLETFNNETIEEVPPARMSSPFVKASADGKGPRLRLD